MRMVIGLEDGLSLCGERCISEIPRQVKSRRPMKTLFNAMPMNMSSVLGVSKICHLLFSITYCLILQNNCTFDNAVLKWGFFIIATTI